MKERNRWGKRPPRATLLMCDSTSLMMELYITPPRPFRTGGGGGDGAIQEGILGALIF